MEKSASPPLTSTDPVASAKRKRSPSLEASSLPTPPPAKTARPSGNQLQINYLARQYQDILPLVTVDDNLPSLLSIINDYEGVLQRHESMAGNLGARPLGPILMQRFERIFDGPPKILRNHGKEGIQIGWLDVVEFARSKPEQFNLEKMRDGVRVCQFYTKQCRVEISEEDYQLIASGMPQRLIPPQPIEDDEEKELGTLEILEKNLGSIVQAADQVSARARQLNHRLKNRKSAIISRREAEMPTKQDDDAHSPPRNGERRLSLSPTSGFTPVNSRPPLSNGSASQYALAQDAGVANGTSRNASATTRADLLSKFHTSSEREALALASLESPRAGSAHRSSLSQKARSKTDYDYPSSANSTSNPVAIPNTPTSLIPPFNKPAPADRYDDSGPYKADMMLRMEQLNRGDRVQPPCDRCRRLHMDCLKNLTACMGCTKKHAKCSWKDVEKQELEEHPFVPRVVLEAAGAGGASGGEKSGSDGEAGSNLKSSSSVKKDWSKDGSREVRDEELLGESSDDEGLADVPAHPALAAVTGDTDHTTSSLANGAAPPVREFSPSLPAIKSGGDESFDTVMRDAASSAIVPAKETSMATTTGTVTAEQAISAVTAGVSSVANELEAAASSANSDRDRDRDAVVIGSKPSPEVRKHSGGMRWDEETGKMMLDS